jgi:hypothetical protein
MMHCPHLTDDETEAWILHGLCPTTEYIQLLSNGARTQLSIHSRAHEGHTSSVLGTLRCSSLKMSPQGTQTETRKSPFYPKGSAGKSRSPTAAKADTVQGLLHPQAHTGTLSGYVGLSTPQSLGRNYRLHFCGLCLASYRLPRSPEHLFDSYITLTPVA